MHPLIYQNDLGRFFSDRLDAQAGNDKIEACIETKLLDLHQEVRMHPLTYQDYLGRFFSNRLDAQAGIDKIEVCMEIAGFESR